MKGIIKFDWGYVHELDGDCVIEIHMWSMETRSTEWIDLGKSHFMNRQTVIKELDRIKSRGWEVLMVYEGNLF